MGGLIGFGGVVMLYAEQLNVRWLHLYSERGILLLILGAYPGLWERYMPNIVLLVKKK